MITSSVCNLIGVLFSSEISEISLFSSRVMSSELRASSGFISGSAMVKEGLLGPGLAGSGMNIYL